MKLKYNHLIFDLDGTIADSSVGIVNSAMCALEKFNLEKHTEEKIKGIIIGPPLTVGLKRLTGIEDEKIIEGMIVSFREYYAKKGVFENKLYPYISEVLQELYEMGVTLEVLTSKPERFAIQMMDQYNLSKLFVKIDGAGERDKKSMKSEKLQRLKGQKNALMIGDRTDDISAANKNAIDSVAVTYGFDTIENLKNENPTHLINCERELINLVRI